MVERKIKIINPKGIHARPSALLMQTASQFNSEIFLYKNKQRAHLGSIMEILTLGALPGDILRVTAKGSDETEALTAVEKIFQTIFTDNV